MGLMTKPSCSTYDVPAMTLPNPDPKNFVITDARKVGKNVILEAFYPDCRNYEGRKILVYAGTTIAALRRQSDLDPHFSENQSKLSPCARFEPTERGRRLALICALSA